MQNGNISACLHAEVYFSFLLYDSPACLCCSSSLLTCLNHRLGYWCTMYLLPYCIYREMSCFWKVSVVLLKLDEQ